MEKELNREGIKILIAGRSCGDLARDLLRTQGKKFCVGLVLHLVMYISDSYS